MGYRGANCISDLDLVACCLLVAYLVDDDLWFWGCLWLLMLCVLVTCCYLW